MLSKQKRVNSWFISRYHMNLYRGCEHNCVYCDGRNEKYDVQGEFGEQVEVKINAPDLLRRELDPKRRRKPMKPGFILLGGGVGDAYQPAEERWCLSLRVLEVIRDAGWPVHVLTKSPLVLRDLDLLRQIQDRSRCLVSFSFSTVDDAQAAVFEPGVAPPSVRLAALRRVRQAGLRGGMFLMPLIPFVSDEPRRIEQAFAAAHAAHADFVVHAAMTLKQGRQKAYFMRVLKQHYPHLQPEYCQVYRPDNDWGRPATDYDHSLATLVMRLATVYKMPLRIPPPLFNDVLSLNDIVAVMLEHIDTMMKLRGMKSPYGYAAHQIAQLEQPLEQIKWELFTIDGVGKAMAKTIREIVETGRSRLYEEVVK